jgi:hypothetical protein
MTTGPRSHRPNNARSRDHNIAAIRNICQQGRRVMARWVPVVLNGTTAVKADPGRPLGNDGTPVLWAIDETAEVCARHADALAAEAESIARDLMAQVDELSRGNLLAGIRRGFGMHASLRRLSGQLGELHAVLDELAHQARPTDGGA